MFGGQVVFFFQVGAQVVKVLTLSAAQKFPISLANGRLSGPAPIERVVRRGLNVTLEVREQIHSVQVAMLGRKAGDRGGRSSHVECADWMNESLARRNRAGPRDDERRVHAA